jgi:hypothetical protein
MTSNSGSNACCSTDFYLRLTEFRPAGNHVLRSVCLMTPQLTPAAGREDNGFPRSRTGSNSVHIPELRRDLGVRPGESDPARMLSGVLLLVATTVIMVLALAWWLI